MRSWPRPGPSSPRCSTAGAGPRPGGLAGPGGARRLARRALGEGGHPAGLPDPGHDRGAATGPSWPRATASRWASWTCSTGPGVPGGHGRRGSLARRARRHERAPRCLPGAGRRHHPARLRQRRRLGGGGHDDRLPRRSWAPAPRSGAASTSRRRCRWAASWSRPVRAPSSSRTARSWVAAAACTRASSSARGAVIGAGVVLTGQSRLLDLVEERELRGTPEAPLVVPPGRRGRARHAAGRVAPGRASRASAVSVPVIVKYRDEGTSAARSRWRTRCGERSRQAPAADRPRAAHRGRRAGRRPDPRASCWSATARRCTSTTWRSSARARRVCGRRCRRGAEVAFAVKANPIPARAAGHWRRRAWGRTWRPVGELRAVLRAGVAPRADRLHRPRQDRRGAGGGPGGGHPGADHRVARRAGRRSWPWPRWRRPGQGLLLRLATDGRAGRSEPIIGGAGAAKFGLTDDEADEAIARLLTAGLLRSARRERGALPTAAASTPSVRPTCARRRILVAGGRGPGGVGRSGWPAATA